jgi:superfamily II DNA or RNA helicase
MQTLLQKIFTEQATGGDADKTETLAAESSCMYLYSATTPAFTLICRKLGCTGAPHGRLSTYLTGCPPGLTPSQDIEFESIWKTTARSLEELKDLEDIVHDRFVSKRMMRERPGDSEWFRVSREEVESFVESRPWCVRRVPLSEIQPPNRTSRYLRRNYSKNLKFIKQRDTRNTTLGVLQAPMISAIEAFRADPTREAGYAVAPCGSGKTRITAVGIRGTKTCIVCCPSRQIQTQWYATLIAEGTFSASEISFVGGMGTTDPDTIRNIMSVPTFCIISTYMSSHLLADIIDASTELLVLDEAHHMAGVVAKSDTGEGRTRRLMMKATELKVKRLSLTYTPRFIVDAGDTDVLSMDDDAIFGGLIAELKIRDLIRAGVLPDYRLWTLRDEAGRGSGVLGKAQCVLEAWDATEIVRGVERFILDHLIVFASTIQEAKEVEAFLIAKTQNTLVLRVEEGDKLETPLAQFRVAPRSILINCFVLNEGVDIPVANAVAILYPKHSRGQITQMILRAGRWYEGKSIFHVLIPMMEEEDLSGFEEVLSALASCDEQIRDEIVLRASEKQGSSKISLLPNGTSDDTPPECIVIEQFEADNDQIRRCFSSIRKNLFPSKESRRIQQLCVEKGVDTSVEYEQDLLHMIPELPRDPRPKTMLWYDYLHSADTERMSPDTFVKTVLEPNGLRVGHIYDGWRQGHSTSLPSLQHITDGYFGSKYSDFNALLSVHGTRSGGRGR